MTVVDEAEKVVLTVRERERTGDSKLLDHMSDFRRNNTIRLSYFN